MSRRPDCSIIIPTHNRREVLASTLARLLELPDRAAIEIIVVDNQSTDGTPRLADEFPAVRWVLLNDNLACAARNVGAVAAEAGLLLMLDDDSWPEPGAIDRIVRRFEDRIDLGAIACRVRLADPPFRHDAGGVPGIFFNCGGAVRRAAFLEAGGFPIDFEYYAEEYDLACRLWQRGWVTEAHGDILVWHRRVLKNRDNNRMVRLLVRNNLRLWRRYAPPSLRDELLAQTIERYHRVALKENAEPGFHAGIEQAEADAARAPRARPLSIAQFADLFGLRNARANFLDWADNFDIKTVAIFARGKGCEQLLSMLKNSTIRIDAVYDTSGLGPAWYGLPLRHEMDFDPARVDGIIVGSLSPGLSEDLRDDLAGRYPGLPVLTAAPFVMPAQVARCNVLAAV